MWVVCFDECVVNVFSVIKKRIYIFFVVDIYFDYWLVFKVIDVGVDKIWINFGNIGCCDWVEKVVNVVKVKNILICIGVNVGSLEKKII